ncbi:hypothetical protein [Sorangium sp. So ce131]|uniref:hypothetical protein n=1 Tax=Sorangium sp. So ce131 TaxID=3133282 RepID=UPI003F60C507
MTPISGCPARSCRASNPSVRSLTHDERAKIPAEVMARKGADDSESICAYCGFVWFSPPPEPFRQLPPIPAGYLEENRFVVVDVRHPLKRST